MRSLSRWARYVAPFGALFLGAATCERQSVPLRADFEAPQALSLVCLHQVAEGEPPGTFCPEDLDDTGNPIGEVDQFVTVPLESCKQIEDEDDANNLTNTQLPNSFLFLLVANVTRGDVGVVSLSSSSTPQPLDSDNSTPGVNFIPVGDFPRAIAVDSDAKHFVTANAASNDLSVFENTDLLRCFTNRATPPTVALGGSPQDMALDANGIAYVTLPDQGELVAVDTRANPPVVVARADLTLNAPGATRPNRIALSEVRRVAYVSNGLGTFITEVNLDALLLGNAQLNFIEVGSRTGVIAYSPAQTVAFEGELPDDAIEPEPIDAPEALYVASLDLVGQILVVDAEARALVNLRPDDPLGLGPGIRVGFSDDILNPITDIRFFTEPLLPISIDPEEDLPRGARPDNLQGVFALVTTNDLLSFTINLAPHDPDRLCCTLDDNTDVALQECTDEPTLSNPDGTCDTDIFLPAQSIHTVRNANLRDDPDIGGFGEPILSIGGVRVDPENPVVTRFPAVGTSPECLDEDAGTLCSYDIDAETRISLPTTAGTLFTETWDLVFEGIIPGTERAGVPLVGNSLRDLPLFCERGVEVGDIVQILSPLSDDAPAECTALVVPPSVSINGAFQAAGSPVDELVTAEVEVVAVRAGELTVAPREGVAGPADLSACFGNTVAYRVRVADVFLVRGSEPSHVFLHRQITNPDGSCGVDETIDPRFTARAAPGTIFENVAFRLELTDVAPPTNAEGVPASFRDAALQFAIVSGFTPWAIDPDNTAATGAANIAGGAVITPDGLSAFVSDINQDRIFELILTEKSADPTPIF